MEDPAVIDAFRWPIAAAGDNAKAVEVEAALGLIDDAARHAPFEEALGNLPRRSGARSHRRLHPPEHRTLQDHREGMAPVQPRERQGASTRRSGIGWDVVGLGPATSRAGR